MYIDTEYFLSYIFTFGIWNLILVENCIFRFHSVFNSIFTPLVRSSVLFFITCRNKLQGSGTRMHISVLQSSNGKKQPFYTPILKRYGDERQSRRWWTFFYVAIKLSIFVSDGSIHFGRNAALNYCAERKIKNRSTCGLFYITVKLKINN